jgi:hypothetical protein
MLLMAFYLHGAAHLFKLPSSGTGRDSAPKQPSQHCLLNMPLPEELSWATMYDPQQLLISQLVLPMCRYGSSCGLTIVLESKGPLDAQAVQAALDCIAARHGAGLLRRVKQRQACALKATSLAYLQDLVASWCHKASLQ